MAADHYFEGCRGKQQVFHHLDAGRADTYLFGSCRTGKNRLAQEKYFRQENMNKYGWFFLIFSWATILWLTAFCFMKVFSKKELK